MQRFDFNIGAKVQGSDGQCGKLAQLVVDPETKQVTDLIVRNGLLLSDDRVLPISSVRRTMADEIYLSISSDELSQFPQYHEREYEEPAEGGAPPSTQIAVPYGIQSTPEPVVPMIKHTVREGIEPDQQLIEKGMHVNNVDGLVGKINHVVVDREDETITHLVVQRGLIFTDKIIIPASMVEDIFEEHIFISGTNETLEQLQHYDPDKVDLTELP